jgi:hypothetical protein
MQDSTKVRTFKDATEVARNGFSMLEKQFTLLQDTISILTRLTTIKSLVSERAWPILLFAAVLPFANTWLEKLDEPHRQHPRTFLYFSRSNGKGDFSLGSRRLEKAIITEFEGWFTNSLWIPPHDLKSLFSGQGIGLPKNSTISRPSLCALAMSSERVKG